MKLWILGANGMLGSSLVRLCKERLIEHTATGRECDISQLSQLKKLLHSEEGQGVTHLINCAAYTNVDMAEKEPEAARQVNALGPENVGLAANAISAKVIHISTDYVFGGEIKRPLVETDPCNPVGVYARTKREGEKNLLEVCPSACIIRSSWIFGQKGKNFISSFLDRIRQDEVLRVISDQRGRPTFAEDLAEAILSMLCHSGIFHFANEGDVSRFQMAEKILQHARQLEIPLACRELIPVDSSFFPTAAKRPPYSVLNTDKIAALLGAKPRPWEEAMKDYFRYAL